MKSEITTIAKAINRLSYTTANSNKCNSTDVEALNFIIDFVNNANETAFNENQLYCKLYADALIANFNFYKCIEKANEQVNKTAEMNLFDLIFKLKNEMNSYYFNNYIKEKGIKDVWLGKFPADKGFLIDDLKVFFELNKEEILKIREENLKIFKGISIEDFKKSFEIYTYDEVFNLFKINANLSFNKFKNLK